MQSRDQPTDCQIVSATTATDMENLNQISFLFSFFFLFGSKSWLR